MTRKPKGVNLNPKTDAEALTLLRWMYGAQVPAYEPTKK